MYRAEPRNYFHANLSVTDNLVKLIISAQSFACLLSPRGGGSVKERRESKKFLTPLPPKGKRFVNSMEASVYLFLEDAYRVKAR